MKTANRELDVWIAENVMDKCEFEPHHTNNAICAKCGHDCSFEAHQFPSYSESASGALGVFEMCIAFESEGAGNDSIKIHGGISGYGITDGYVSSDGETLPLAICNFAKNLFSK